MWVLGQLFTWAVDPNGGILDSHLFFYDRYSDLAEYHRLRGRTAKAERLAAIAEAYYQAAPDDDDEPEAAAMAMPVPHPLISRRCSGAFTSTILMTRRTFSSLRERNRPAGTRCTGARFLRGKAASMGLDGVEIVMRTEETFGIEIPNEVAARLLTPAALVDFVAANVPLKATGECLRSSHRSVKSSPLRRTQE